VSVEEIRLDVEVPEPSTVARTVEVRCGASCVTIRQVMSARDEDWTVYEGDGFDQGRNKGTVGKIEKAPRGDNAEELIPWASDLVTRRERKRLALAALGRQVDDQPHAVEET
jgi:hypothetical protein